MSEDLLSFPIDVKKTLKHLRQDMRDDWFYDVVGYEDLFNNSENLNTILLENLDQSHGEYAPGIKSVYDVPKRSLGLRYTLELDFYDRFIYQAICSYLIPFFDPLLSNRVFSHRYNKYGKVNKYLFKHPIELWNTFENITFVALKKEKYLLVTDLLNYFEQISIESIEKSFIEMIQFIDATGSTKNTIRNAVSTLIGLMEKWSFNGRIGLPQNRDPSAFIANVVLNHVDKNMVKKGYDYFRYVDDIRIICDDENHAKRALNSLIYELREFGLNINSKKTEILSNNSENVEEFFPSTSDSMVLIDSMWRSRSKKVIIRSIPLLYDLLVEKLQADDTQSRPFRYCINRFKALISSDLFDTKSILAKDIADVVIRELDKQPVSTDQFCKLLMDLDLDTQQLDKIKDFVINPLVAIHGWQNYHILILLAYKTYEAPDLIDHCKKLIMESPFKPEVAACFIYLSSVDKVAEVEKFIPEFDSRWPYQHQRYFLLSLQDTKQEKLKPLYKHLGFRVKGTISRFKKTKAFKTDTVYISSFKSNPITQIYDELSPYE